MTFYFFESHYFDYNTPGLGVLIEIFNDLYHIGMYTFGFISIDHHVGIIG